MILLKKWVVDYFIDFNRFFEGRYMWYSDIEWFDEFNFDLLFVIVDSILIYFFFLINIYIEVKFEYDNEWYYYGGIIVFEYFVFFLEYLK